MITSQLGFSATSASLISLARATPSCRLRFIFQLPATIFFLIFFLFFKRLNILLLSCLFLIHFVHAQSRSAIVRAMSGTKNVSSTMSRRSGVLSFCAFPMGNCSSGAVRSSVCGSALWLHLPIIVPSFSRISPGLLRIIVFSVVSSALQNVYSAPVKSRQRSMSSFVDAVRHKKSTPFSSAYSYIWSMSPKLLSSATASRGETSRKV